MTTAVRLYLLLNSLVHPQKRAATIPSRAPSTTLRGPRMICQVLLPEPVTACRGACHACYPSRKELMLSRAEGNGALGQQAHWPPYR